jgi:hypothetical protein
MQETVSRQGIVEALLRLLDGLFRSGEFQNRSLVGVLASALAAAVNNCMYSPLVCCCTWLTVRDIALSYRRSTSLLFIQGYDTSKGRKPVCHRYDVQMAAQSTDGKEAT